MLRSRSANLALANADTLCQVTVGIRKRWDEMMQVEREFQTSLGPAQIAARA